MADEKDIDMKTEEEAPELEEVSFGDNESEEAEDGVYEISYIIVPSVGNDGLASEVGKIKAIIEKNSKSIISETFPEMKELSYEMVKHVLGKNQKFDSGYFGWVKFESSADNIKNIKKAVEEIHSILRFLIVKTVRENTIVGLRSRITRRPVVEAEPVIISSPHAPETHSEMSDEEIDKEIDKTLGNLEV